MLGTKPLLSPDGLAFCDTDREGWGFGRHNLLTDRSSSAPLRPENLLTGDKVMREFLSNFWTDESGISSVEYALLLAFVAAGIITAAELLSDAVENEMSATASCIESGSGC